jgi:hypothetical protein
VTDAYNPAITWVEASDDSRPARRQEAPREGFARHRRYPHDGSRIYEAHAPVRTASSVGAGEYGDNVRTKLELAQSVDGDAG